MTVRTGILVLIFLTLSLSAFGQKEGKKKYDKSRQVSNTELLQQARDLQTKAPKKAIPLLEQVIRNKRKSRKEEGEAYVLLGNIYEDIGQQDLALQRYRQALDLLNRDKKGLSPTAPIHQRMGQIYLNQGSDVEAEASFKLCVQESDDNNLSVKCQQGLANIELMRGNISNSLSQLDFVEGNYQLDSISVSQIEATRSQNYLQQKDYSKATESYYNSVQNLPKNQQIEEEDYAPIQKAQEDILNYGTTSPTEEIELRMNTATLNENNVQNNQLLLAENLKLAELFEKANNLPEAEKFVSKSKAAINEDTKAASVAEVYKKSYEINRKKGLMDAALDDLENYIQAKETAIRDLQQDLADQIDIVKGQQQIDLVQKDFDIEEKDAALMLSQLNTQRILIGFLSLLLIASLVFFYFLFKNVKAKRKANQLLLIKSLRTQMNPHFIFNALNSVNNFIAKNDEKAANKFLAEFSNLMRKVLDYSQKDFISFEEELELNELYLKLEHFRFRDKFDYTFENKVNQATFDLEVPPMLIQPFIENAVWHGLRYKDDKGKLEVSIDQKANNIIISIKDDGIGRANSKALKTANQKKYKSTGLANVSKRLALINDTYGKNYEISVEDLNSNSKDTGTLVRIVIPVQ